MRVVFAPDKFAGTLTAVQAAQAMAAGWRETAPADELILMPLADGGPGFVDVIGASPGADPQWLAVPVPGPLGGDDVPATVLVRGRTAYVESAQACGLAVVPADRRDPTRATTYGVGLLLAAALDAGVDRIVVGLGGSATNDGGAGLLAALGATAEPNLLRGGGLGLAELTSVDLAAARGRCAGVDLVVATDVDVPLAGPGGASMSFAAQKGATYAQAAGLDAALAHFGRLSDAKVAAAPGAGAAGGLGHALLLLGATRVSGVQAVMDLVGFEQEASRADLLVTGEGCFDHLSARGKVPAGVAHVGQRLGRPVIVLAGRMEVGRREMAAMGVESAYAVADTPAQVRASLAHPVEGLTALAARVARSWSH